MGEDNKKLTLLREASNATSLQQIADLAYDILGNPIFIEDRSSIKLAYSQYAEVKDPKWNNEIVCSVRKARPKQKNVKEMYTGYQSAIEHQLPVVINDSDMPEQRMIKPIVMNGNHVATIVATGYMHDFSDEDVEIVEILSHFVAAIMKQEHYFLSTSEHAIENLLIRILNGEKFSAESIKEQMKILHWSTKAYTYVLDIFPQREPDHPKDINAVIEEFRALNACRAVSYDNHIVCILSMDEEYSHWPDAEISVTPIMEKYNFIAGVSQSFQNLNQLRFAYLQAQSMSEIATVLKNGPIYYPYDEGAIYHLLELTDNRFPLKQFCHKKVLELEEYDTKHHTDLVPTLHAYLESFRSISHTAEVMYIHRNTVSYRINKCFEILGTRVEDGNELFSFNFSLRILEYYNKKQGKLPPHWKY